MKILLISPIPPPYGGIARWTENIQEYLSADNDISIVDTSLVKGKNNSPVSIKYYQIKRTIRILKNLGNSLKKWYDVAHINSSCTSIGIVRDYLCARILFHKSIPFVFHCHCNVVDQLGNNIISKYVFKKTLGMAGLVYVLNRSSESYCNEFVNSKVKMCANSIDESKIVDKHTISSEIKTAVFVGHLYKTKGIDTIVATAKRYPQILFKVIGKYTEMYNETKNTDNLVFVGEKSNFEIMAELDMADVFIFPSHTEGFSIALLEAMARGLPVIATDVGANRDMIEDKGGIILDQTSDDPLDLSGLSNVKTRRDMSEWCIKKVESNYTHRIVFKIIENDYRSLMKK